MGVSPAGAWDGVPARAQPTASTPVPSAVPPSAADFSNRRRLSPPSACMSVAPSHSLVSPLSHERPLLVLLLALSAPGWLAPGWPGTAGLRARWPLPAGGQ